MTNNHPTLSVDPHDGVPAYMTEVSYDWALRRSQVGAGLGPEYRRSDFAFPERSTPDACLSQRNHTGMKVWQVAHVYGDLVKRVAQKVGPKGRSI